MDDLKKKEFERTFAWINNCLDGIENDRLRTDSLVKSEASVIRSLVTKLERLVFEEN